MNKKSILLLLILFFIFGSIYFVFHTKETTNNKTWIYQLQNAEPREILEYKPDIVVIDYSRDGTEEGRYKREEIELLKKNGIIPIAYISIGEAERYRFYWNNSWDEELPDFVDKENPEWKENYAVKYWDSRWKKIIFSYIDRIIEEGFSGVYLDKIDEYEYWEGNGIEKEYAIRSMIELVEEISEYSRNKSGKDFIIIPQNGECIIEYDDKILDYVSGWAAEDVFFSSEREKRLRCLEKIKNKGKMVLSVEYLNNMSIAKKYVKEAREYGFIPYPADSRELDDISKFYPIVLE